MMILNKHPPWDVNTQAVAKDLIGVLESHILGQKSLREVIRNANKRKRETLVRESARILQTDWSESLLPCMSSINRLQVTFTRR